MAPLAEDRGFKPCETYSSAANLSGLLGMREEGATATYARPQPVEQPRRWRPPEHYRPEKKHWLFKSPETNPYILFLFFDVGSILHFHRMWLQIYTNNNNNKQFFLLSTTSFFASDFVRVELPICSEFLIFKNCSLHETFEFLI